jgi:hypothetical protein
VRGLPYYSLRDVMGLTVSEVDGFGVILARANGMLNYRRVLGFRVLGSGSSKRCGFKVEKRLKRQRPRLGPWRQYVPVRRIECGRKAVVGVLMEIGGKRFMVYLCPVHFKRFLDNMVKYVRHRAEKTYERVMKKAMEINPLLDAEEMVVFFQGVGNHE